MVLILTRLESIIEKKLHLEIAVFLVLNDYNFGWH